MTYQYRLSLLPLVTVSCLTLCNGCMLVGPDYEQPSVKLENQYADSRLKTSIGEIATTAWWEGYGDPLLNTLVTEGLDQNLDIALAVERISEARATLHGKGLNQVLSGGADYAHTYYGSDTTKAYGESSASLTGNIVIDLFGGIRREQQAAAAQLKSAIDDVATARLAYLSELIGAYIDARYYQYATKLTKQSINTREQTLRITQEQHAVGNSTELDIEQVKALLFAAKADIPDMEANYLAQIYVIATLINKPAQLLVERMQDEKSKIELPGLNLDVKYDTGIPVDLIRNRPDIRSAEQSLVASTANIGVATADMLPSIQLSGTISGLSAATWSFGPSIDLPIFNQASLAAQRNVAISETKQAEIAWRQTILDAIQDVQTANSAWLRDRDKVKFLKLSMDAYNRSLDLSLKTYEVGITGLLDVLDTDRSLASARIEFANALRSMSINWATLQIALGAGSSVNANDAESQ